MSRQSNNLQLMAYRAITDSMRKEIKQDPKRTAEQSVMERMHNELMTTHKTKMKRWVSSAKIPVEIQSILVLANHFTQPTFYKATKKLREKEYDYKYDDILHSTSDFFDEFMEYIKVEDFDTDKERFLVHNTFDLLCFKRLKNIFKLKLNDFVKPSDEFPNGEGIFSREFMNIIIGLEDSEILPHIIYKLLDKTH